MSHPRAGHRAILLPSGMVLVAAGSTGTPSAINTAELYTPATDVAALQVSGRGSIQGPGGRASFSLRASGDRGSGSLTFSDPAAGVSLTKAKVRTVTFNDDSSAELSGSARLGDGSNVTYSVSVTDGGGSADPDTFSITLSNGYSAGGTLAAGNIVIE